MSTPPSTPKWAELNDLSSSSVGGEVVFSTDDWFAGAERMLDQRPAEWREGFTEQGKWMDGWETRRKRIPGHDWCIIKLGLPGHISGVELDTSYFTGNYAPRASVQAAWLPSPPQLEERQEGAGQAATPLQIQAATRLGSDKWTEIVPIRELGPGTPDTCKSFFAVAQSGPYNYIRLNIFPDGGVARLRTYGVAVPSHPPTRGQEVDLVAAEVGGVCVGYSDAHYGHPRNMIQRGRGKDMGDGWETARRLDRPSVLKLVVEGDSLGILAVPGSEWAIFKLGIPGKVTNIEVDTNHFKGNFPDSVSVDIATLPPNTQLDNVEKVMWRVLLPAKKLTAHAQHYFRPSIQMGAATHVRVRMFPDGGISRVRLIGTPL